MDENTENKNLENNAEKIIPENKKAEGSFTLIIFMMLIALLIASLWEKTPAIKNSVHAVLNPSAGFLLDWNLSIGMLIVVFIITLLMTIVQKYATNQKALKELKKEQKEIQQQMKEFKAHPEKLIELQKKQFKLIPKQFKLSMRGIAYTAIPFILFFRWFGDYFIEAGNPKLLLFFFFFFCFLFFFFFFFFFFLKFF